MANTADMIQQADTGSGTYDYSVNGKTRGMLGSGEFVSDSFSLVEA